MKKTVSGIALYGRKTHAGFTIVELLIVIIVIAILVAIGLVSYSAIQNRSKTTAGQATATTVIKKIETYYTVNSVYPTYTQLQNNYAPGSTTPGSGNPEARLDNPNSIVNAGLSAASAAGGTVVQYNDCTTAHPDRSVVYWSYQTGAAVSEKSFGSC